MSKVKLLVEKFEKNIDTNLLNPSYYYNIILEKQYLKLLYDYLISTKLENAKKYISSLISILTKQYIEKTYNYKIYLSHFIIYVFHKRQYKNDEKNPKSKEIFYHSLHALLEHNPNILKKIIYNDLISWYGYCKDYFNFWSFILKKIESDYKIQISKEYCKNIKYNKTFNFVYQKYNHIIVAIISVVNYKKNKDLEVVNNFLISNKNNFRTESININKFVDWTWSKYGITSLQHLNNVSRNILLDFFLKRKSFSTTSFISKIGMYLPRQGKTKKYFWFINKDLNENNIIFPDSKTHLDNNRFKYKKKLMSLRRLNGFDYLTANYKFLYESFDLTKVNNSDRKRYRINTSILNKVLDTPQIHLCNNEIDKINFLKCGKKFLKKNENMFLMRDKKSVSIKEINKRTREQYGFNYKLYSKKNKAKKKFLYYNYFYYEENKKYKNMFLKNKINRDLDLFLNYDRFHNTNLNSTEILKTLLMIINHKNYIHFFFFVNELLFTKYI